MKGKVFFISGIDTNVGKTFACGILARTLASKKKSVITQKMIQTGCVGSSEDIEMHRKLQGIPPTEEDRTGETCPYIFSYPCSPHMAAEKDGRTIDLSVVTQATRHLQEKYDYVLLEGAGGLMVPCTRQILTIDYIREQNYPLFLVTSGQLGSINHTLLSLAACKQSGIEVKALLYNEWPSEDERIEKNTRAYLTDYLDKYFPHTPLLLLPEEKADWPARIDLSPLPEFG